MDDIARVKVLQSQRNLYEKFPNEVFCKKLAVLPLYQTAQITVLAKLHHDVDLLVDDPRVIVPNDVGTVKISKHLDFA